MSTVTPPVTTAYPSVPVPQPPAAAAFSRYAVTHLPTRRFTVDEYHRLIEQHYLGEEERCELLEGWIIAKMGHTPIHSARLAHAARVLSSRLPPGWHARVQLPITTSDSEPEPDLAIVRGTELDYERRQPGPADIALLVEVALTSVDENRALKARVYSRGPIVVYWIMNLVDRRIEVYKDPDGPDAAPVYRRREDFVGGQDVPLVIGGVNVGPVPAADLLP